MDSLIGIFPLYDVWDVLFDFQPKFFYSLFKNLNNVS